MSVSFASKQSVSSPRLKPRRRFADRVLLVFGCVLTVVMLLGAFAASWVLRQYKNVTFEQLSNVTAAPDGEASNWLLVGTDSREGISDTDPNSGALKSVDGKRTDTIMIVKVDQNTRSVDLLSLPRDLWVTIPGKGEDRINAAYNTGSKDPSVGRERLVETIENNLDIDINHYVEIDFNGFQNVVDALDGVSLCFPGPARDTKSGLLVTEEDLDAEGCAKLDGSQSLAYARSRTYQVYENGTWRTDPSGDLGRNQRQRDFIAQVAGEISSKVGSGNVVTLDRVASAAGDNLVLSDGVSFGEMTDFARIFQEAGGENIRSHSLDEHVRNARISGKDVLQLRQNSAQRTLDIFRYSHSGLPVQVLNGSGVAGQAGSIAEQLKAGGYVVSSFGDAEESHEKTTVYFHPNYKSVADSLAELVGGAEFVEHDSYDLVLVSGKNFTQG